MRKISLPFLLFAIFASNTTAGRVLSLDSCRTLALRNNKQLLISDDKIEAAEYEQKAARTHYLPRITATGAYTYTTRSVNLLSKNQKSTLQNLGTNTSTQVQQAAEALAEQFPVLAPLIQSLGTINFPTLNNLGNDIVKLLQTDTHNLFAGSLILTQPLYMGGRIKAYNNITHYTRLLLGNEQNEKAQQTILETDQAYWQVVSLANKKKLAISYLNMLQKMNDDIQKMYKQGVTTKANTLTVNVRLNEADMTLTKVEDGLSLSRMLLCQICGLPIDTNIELADEKDNNIDVHSTVLIPDTITAFQSRQDLKMLEQTTKIADENVKLVHSAYLPQLALFGGYTLTNPNIYNGFRDKFGSNINIGVAMYFPLWTWNEGKYHIRAAKAEARASRHLYDDAKEKINLQLNQAKFKVDEANKHLITTKKNLEKANENLHYADVGFHEGVINTSDLLAAQTAWMEAESQKLDAQIDVKITNICLLKALGVLGTNN